MVTENESGCALYCAQLLTISETKGGALNVFRPYREVHGPIRRVQFPPKEKHTETLVIPITKIPSGKS